METTLNIHIDILNKISMAAQSYGMSRSELIRLLIKKVMDDIPNPGRLGTMVQYQKRSKPDDWYVFHLQIRVDDYEYFLDLRKLLKMSVSLILAYAVNKFMDQTTIIKTDNYWYRHYIIIREIFNGVICWKFIWGFPSEIYKLLPNSQN